MAQCVLDSQVEPLRSFCFAKYFFSTSLAVPEFARTYVWRTLDSISGKAYCFARTSNFSFIRGEPMNPLSYMTRRTLPLLAAVLIFSSTAPCVIAQNPAPGPTWSQEDTLRIAKEVQKKLGGLTNFSVFDWITFGFHGKTVVLRGYASRPTLKSDAANAVKGIAGIESVDNQIEVLPNSPNDDRIRAAVYNRIYTQPTLAKYNANQGSLARALGPGGRSVALMAGGITNDPPMGFHAIHIIVKNGNVILYGVVNNEMDKAIAGMQANSAPGAFSVDNDLIVQGAASKPAEK
jgi:osmotically-inducible protein OsmY